jgi:hypothetical protein
MAATRTQGITIDTDGNFTINKEYRPRYVSPAVSICPSTFEDRTSVARRYRTGCASNRVLSRQP